MSAPFSRRPRPPRRGIAGRAPSFHDVMEADEAILFVNSFSKNWAMTGWRLGWVANRALAPTFTRWITNTESCASQISQWAGVEAISGPQGSVDAMHARYRERRDLIVRLLNDVPGVACRTPGGAFYAWPNVTEA